ncbi:MAG: type III pantothenate kinase [Clostridia bacterium]|nr:type III pantothenate kinase [Clostridia bacterium]
MLLAVNVGNKLISFAIFENESIEIISKFKISADKNRTADEYVILVKQLLDYSGIDATAICGAIVASVVPQLNDVINHVVLALTGKAPLLVGPGVKTGFAIRIDDPAELGADIVANCAVVVAMAKAEKLDRPAIVLDMGAVTTLFAISKKGEVIGGSILPGVEMSLDALHRETAQLPNIEMSGSHRAIGKNTKESLISGVLFGQAAMIDGLIDRFEKEMKCDSGEAMLFATGEHCKPILGNFRHQFYYDSVLTLKGLACIYQNTVG